MAICSHFYSGISNCFSRPEGFDILPWPSHRLSICLRRWRSLLSCWATNILFSSPCTSFQILCGVNILSIELHPRPHFWCHQTSLKHYVPSSMDLNYLSIPHRHSSAMFSSLGASSWDSMIWVGRFGWIANMSVLSLCGLVRSFSAQAICHNLFLAWVVTNFALIVIHQL